MFQRSAIQLTPYSGRFCVQSFAAQDFGHFPAISPDSNRMKTGILQDRSRKNLRPYIWETSRRKIKETDSKQPALIPLTTDG
jgi:hypothetical protein